MTVRNDIKVCANCHFLKQDNDLDYYCAERLGEPVSTDLLGVCGDWQLNDNYPMPTKSLDNMLLALDGAMEQAKKGTTVYREGFRNALEFLKAAYEMREPKFFWGGEQIDE